VRGQTRDAMGLFVWLPDASASPPVTTTVCLFELVDNARRWHFTVARLAMVMGATHGRPRAPGGRSLAVGGPAKIAAEQSSGQT
jgi:hypothetical protein